jgi:hypothetical protein
MKFILQIAFCGKTHCITQRMAVQLTWLLLHKTLPCNPLCPTNDVRHDSSYPIARQEFQNNSGIMEKI